jgi:uncharacterized protein YndB with AHSA1/START domain
MPAIHQEVTFAATPEKVYAAYTDEKQHAAFTGAPATIASTEGGAWSCHNGGITGRMLTLIPNKLIVQAWRASGWPEGAFSLVRIALEADGNGTKVVLDHDALPTEAVAHIDGGWHKMYWEPMTAYFAKK